MALHFPRKVFEWLVGAHAHLEFSTGKGFEHYTAPPEGEKINWREQRTLVVCTDQGGDGEAAVWFLKAEGPFSECEFVGERQCATNALLILC